MNPTDGINGLIKNNFFRIHENFAQKHFEKNVAIIFQILYFEKIQNRKRKLRDMRPPKKQKKNEERKHQFIIYNRSHKGVVHHKYS